MGGGRSPPFPPPTGLRRSVRQGAGDGVCVGGPVSVKARDTAVPRSQAGWTVPRAPRCWTLSGWGSRESHRAARRPGARGRAGRSESRRVGTPVPA